MKPIKCVACGKDRLGPIWNTANVCRNCRCLANRLIKNNFTTNEIYFILKGYEKLMKSDNKMSENKIKEQSILNENKVIKLKIAEINIKNRFRETNSDKVKEIAESIRKIGLLQPIKITKDKRLVLGLHRTEAYKLLGYDEIDCIITNEKDPLKLKIMELDENIIRAEFTVLERAEALKEKKEIYEKLYPKTKHGIAGAVAKYSANEKNSLAKKKTFTEDTADKMGKNQRTIQQEVQIAENIIPEVKKEIKKVKIKDKPLENKKSDLIELSRLTPKKQQEVMEELKKDKHKTMKVKEAHQKVLLDELVYRIKKEVKWKLQIIDIPDLEEASFREYRSGINERILNELNVDTEDLVAKIDFTSKVENYLRKKYIYISGYGDKARKPYYKTYNINMDNFIDIPEMPETEKYNYRERIRNIIRCCKCRLWNIEKYKCGNKIMDKKEDITKDCKFYKKLKSEPPTIEGGYDIPRKVHDDSHDIIYDENIPPNEAIIKQYNEIYDVIKERLTYKRIVEYDGQTQLALLNMVWEIEKLLRNERDKFGSYSIELIDSKRKRFKIIQIRPRKFIKRKKCPSCNEYGMDEEDKEINGMLINKCEKCDYIWYVDNKTSEEDKKLGKKGDKK